MTKIYRMNSLVFYNNEFYLDQRMNKKVGESGDGYEKLKNKITQLPAEGAIISLPDNFKYLFPILIEINKLYDVSEFITIYNDYLIPKARYVSYSNWIGFIASNEYYVYNMRSTRLFKVNKLFLENFEYVIKDIDLVNHSSKDYKEVRELIEKND